MKVTENASRRVAVVTDAFERFSALAGRIFCHRWLCLHAAAGKNAEPSVDA
jgi:hypothetical protein